MRIYVLLFVFLIPLLCHCTEKYPEGDIKEICIYMLYKAKDPKRLEDQIKRLLERGRIKNREEFKKKYPLRLNLGDESFSEHPTYFYCYDEECDKATVFNKNLLVRSYDRENNLLSEDYLRAKRIDVEDNEFSTVSYIPYSPKIHVISIVRLVRV